MQFQHKHGKKHYTFWRSNQCSCIDFRFTHYVNRFANASRYIRSRFRSEWFCDIDRGHSRRTSAIPLFLMDMHSRAVPLQNPPQSKYIKITIEQQCDDGCRHTTIERKDGIRRSISVKHGNVSSNDDGYDVISHARRDVNSNKRKINNLFCAALVTMSRLTAHILLVCMRLFNRNPPWSLTLYSQFAHVWFSSSPSIGKFPAHRKWFLLLPTSSTTKSVAFYVCTFERIFTARVLHILRCIDTMHLHFLQKQKPFSVCSNVGRRGVREMELNTIEVPWIIAVFSFSLCLALYAIIKMPLDMSAPRAKIDARHST